MRIVTFDVRRDDDAGVWYASSTSDAGIVTEAATIEALRERLKLLVAGFPGDRGRTPARPRHQGLGHRPGGLMVEIGPRLKRILRKAGYEYYRSAKGDHEIWRHPETQKQVSARRGHEIPPHGE